MKSFIFTLVLLVITCPIYAQPPIEYQKSYVNTNGYGLMQDTDGRFWAMGRSGGQAALYHFDEQFDFIRTYPFNLGISVASYRFTGPGSGILLGYVFQNGGHAGIISLDTIGTSWSWLDKPDYANTAFLDAIDMGNGDVWAIGLRGLIVNFGAAGDSLWAKTIPSPTIKELVFTGGKRISRERVLLSGHLKSGSHSASPLPTNYLYYADTLGNKIWDFHFGTNRDASYKMVQYDSTSFYCIVADEMNNLSRTDHINPKIYKIQISETGAQILWEQEHDIAPEDTNNVRATEVVDAKRTRDGGLILLNLLDQDQTGITPEFQHIKLMKIGPDGSLQWDYTYGTEHWDNPSAVIQTQDGGYAVLGTRIFTGGGGIEMFFDKFKSDGLTNLDPEETNSSNIQVQPSPVQDWLEVSLGEKGSYQITLYDLQGRVLWTDHAETHFASVQRKIPVTQLSSGIYLLQVQHEGAIWQKKILKQ